MFYAGKLALRCSMKKMNIQNQKDFQAKRPNQNTEVRYELNTDEILIPWEEASLNDIRHLFLL